MNEGTDVLTIVLDGQADFDDAYTYLADFGISPEPLDGETIEAEVPSELRPRIVVQLESMHYAIIEG